MALITRVSRLFRADLHAVLDRIEEPDVLLRQAVREMEDALAREEQQARLLGHERDQLAGRAREIDAALARIAEELDLCFESGKAELARALVRRRLETEALGAAVQRRRAGVEQRLAALDERLARNRRSLETMRQKAELLAEAHERDHRREPAWPGPEVAVRDEDVELAFLREQRRRAGS